MEFFGEGAAAMNWMRASGLILILLLLAACGGEASQGPDVIVAEMNGTMAASMPFAQEAEAAPLSDAALIEMGRTLYTSNCAPCHQPNGEGNLSTFPALNRNPFVTVSDPTGAINTVMHGRQLMPAFESTLSAQEVAAVLSYVRSAWNNQAPVVSESQVREAQEG